jgi:hypothetical protein
MAMGQFINCVINELSMFASDKRFRDKILKLELKDGLYDK